MTDPCKCGEAAVFFGACAACAERLMREGALEWARTKEENALLRGQNGLLQEEAAALRGRLAEALTGARVLERRVAGLERAPGYRYRYRGEAGSPERAAYNARLR